MTEPALTIDKLRADVAAMLEIDPGEVGDADNLMDLGLDSMRAMNLTLQWGDEGVPLDFADLAENMTLGEIWTVIEDRQDN